MSASYSVADVASHSTASSAWLIINNGVYDVSSFLDSHPGGKKILLNVAGKDATKQFNSFHKPETLTKYAKLKIGTIGAAAAAEKSSVAVVASKPADPRYFGALIPFGDPNWYQGLRSPYYKAHHIKLRASVREFIDTEIMNNIHEWDEAKQIPKELFKKLAQRNLLAGVVGAPWPVEYCPNLPIGMKPEEYDAFAELITADELARPGSGGLSWGLFGGLSIGLPPIYKFGSKALKDKVCPPCFQGEKFICLAVTEPEAGSDVAGLCTTAVKSADGKHYIVNGSKKWITNGVFCDYFTTAVRTGGPGHDGVSLLLIERGPGVTTKQMNCQGVWCSGTAFITFEDVKVPVENLIGKEGSGFKYIMFNFNHERWGLAIQATRYSRVCVEESFKYAMKRRTFGKLLIEHPVIREKLANMTRAVETTYSYVENITYQMTVMSFAEQNELLAAPIALLKSHSTHVMEYCAREAAQIFGGLAYTRGGQGEKVERLYREVRAFAIPGGSEEILQDLAIRESMKLYMKRMKTQKSNQTAKL